MLPVLAGSDDLSYYLQAPVDYGSALLALQNASGVVRSFCRWQITPVYTETLTLDSEDGSILQLPALVVSNVSQVTVDGLPITDFTWSGDGMIARARNAYPMYDTQIDGFTSGGFPSGFRRITVTYTGGYDVVPDEIRAVVLSAAARQYANPQGLMEAVVGGIRVQYPNARSGPKAGTVGGLMLSDDERRVCSSYRVERSA